LYDARFEKVTAPLSLRRHCLASLNAHTDLWDSWTLWTVGLIARRHYFIAVRRAWSAANLIVEKKRPQV